MQGHVRKRHRESCAKKLDPAKRCSCKPRHQARYRDADDPTKWHNKTFDLDREARDWLQAEQGAQLRGDWVNPRKAGRPFSEVLTAWQAGWSGRLSPTTERRYKSIIDNYLTPEFGARPVGSITHEAVQRYIDRLKAEHSPGQVRNVFAVPRTAMAKGVRLGMVKANPCAQVDLPRARHEEMLFLTAEEVRAVAEAIDPAYRLLVYVAAYTGLRAGELAGLQRGDVDLLRGVLHVRRAVKDVNGRLELGPTKTHAERTVSLPAFLAKMLEAHLLASDGGPEDYVFQMKRGGPLRMGLVYGRYFKRAVAGYVKRGEQIPGALPATKHALRWHDLRHTAASLAIHAGAHPLLVSKMLGHSTVQITLDRYSHLMPNVAEALAEKLDAAFAAGAAEPESNVAQLHRV